MNRLITLFLSIFIMSCSSKSELPIEFVLNENWEFKGKDTLQWNSASVPGNIFSDLLDNQIIKDPFIKTNEDSVQWVTRKDWMYKNNFKLPKEVLQKENIYLNFKGLDTYAAIYLNDSLLKNTDNAFLEWNFDIKNIAKKNNTLEVIFTNTNKIATKKENKNPYKLPEGKRIYTRKAQFQYGWDWGPKLNTSGIWKNVSISAWNKNKVRNVFIEQKEIKKNQAALNIIVEFENEILEDITGKVSVNNKSFNDYSKEGKFLKIPVQIENPKLWWTHNLGDPFLYNFSIQIKSDNKIIHQKNIKKGIRTIKLITQKDSIGESFGFELNGKPIYIKGVNYIPQHSFQSKVTKTKYQKLLKDVVAANMNMLRVWGGGIYEQDEFYNLCDEKGILVWQDFMFACAMYPGDSKFLENVQVEAIQQVKRLRNHTSIALWCGNNENSEGWKRWGWQENRSEEEKNNIWNDYLVLFDTILPNVVKKYSQTNYWETSPKYGRGNPKYKYEGDAHDWWIWHDAYPFEHLQKSVPRFMSEFGFQSYPSKEVINYINQKDSFELKSTAIQSHQKHSRGFQLINEYMKRDFLVPSNDEDYAYVSQLLQAKGIVMGIEAQRRAKPYNMGTLYWQLNDCWPAISWSSIDYFGNWKALHYKIKNAYKNVIFSVSESKNATEVYGINDTFSEITDTLNLHLMDFQGNVLWAKKKVVSLEENSSNVMYSLPKVSFEKDATLLKINFKDFESYYYFVKPKKLKLKKETIVKSMQRVSNGYKITLKSNTLQKDVFLQANIKGEFSNNYFDLLPKKEKTLLFKTEDNSILKLELKTLNNLNSSN